MGSSPNSGTSLKVGFWHGSNICALPQASFREFGSRRHGITSLAKINFLGSGTVIVYSILFLNI